MVSAPGLATQASPTLERIRTRPMRPRLIAPRMEILLHPDLHRLLGSLGSLFLVWPLHPLPSYDRLLPLFVASDCVKSLYTVGFPWSHSSSLIAICWNSVFSPQGSRLTHDCDTITRSIPFLTTLMLSDFLILRLCAGGRSSTMCRIANQAAVPSVLVEISISISYVTLLPCNI